VELRKFVEISRERAARSNLNNPSKKKKINNDVFLEFNIIVFFAYVDIKTIALMIYKFLEGNCLKLVK
jgi:hypothetical protein